jgi:hypothetical protein
LEYDFDFKIIMIVLILILIANHLRCEFTQHCFQIIMSVVQIMEVAILLHVQHVQTPTAATRVPVNLATVEMA